MEIITIILQIYFIIFCGFLLQKKFNVNTKVLTYAGVYIFLPSLIFSGLITKPLEWSYFLAPVIFFFASIATLLISVIYTKFAKYKFDDKSIINFTSWGANAGNFGIPVVYFLLGDDGLIPTFLIVVVNAVLMYTLGAYLMAREEKEALRQSIIKVLKLPMIYAFIFGIIFNVFQINIPSFIIEPINTIADALHPCQLILLGTFIAQIKLKEFNKKIVFPSLSFKLLIMPALALLLIKLFNITDTLLAGVILIQSATPIAVNCVILSDFYNRNPKQVAISVFLSTVLALITLPIFWYILKIFI